MPLSYVIWFNEESVEVEILAPNIATRIGYGLIPEKEYSRFDHRNIIELSIKGHQRIRDRMDVHIYVPLPTQSWVL